MACSMRQTTLMSLNTLPTNAVLAMDLAPGYLYETAKTPRNKYRCVLSGKTGDMVQINFFEPHYNHCWMPALVPLDYPFIKLDGDIHKISSRDFGDDLRKRGMKAVGLISNLGMMECWGLYFKRYVREPGGRELIIKAMVAEFPDKAERINKWVDSYKSYYNMGKLPGCIRQEEKVKWVTSNDPLTAMEAEDDDA